MHGPTGIFWANLTPFSRQVLQAAILGSKIAALKDVIESYRKEVDEINKEYQAVTERWN